MRGESFGALATGERLKRIQSSPQYREGRFQNLHPTPNLAEGAGMVKIMFTFFFGKDKRNKPSQKLPSEKTDLLRLDPSEDILVWFGHSSYFLQVNGKKILVDPVFSGHASPVRFTTGSYKGSDNYTPQDMPGIDYLVITHDHWDHLDRATVAALQPKVQRVITGIGTGAHLERWGYAPAVITELDWQQSYMPQQGFTFISLPARHFSGRGFTRDQSLWMSFAFLTPSYRLYLGGDSGYDTHFAAIGEQYGPFDLAILECGQYNLSWPYIHMQPEEVVKAAKDLTAKKLLPVHWAKFSLGLHAWDEPIERLTREAGKQGMAVAHPMIGAKMLLKESQLFDRWWLFENRP
ncbi:MBL fold metallo-hydrolase [Sediminibacterium sp. WSJ-3]|nr:MBL fold metallo-hydrolase [Sediminibacterium soli]